MILSDAVHSLFVLLTTFAYALPMWEGIQRRSVHHTLLFAAQGVLSFVMHCEETGLCAPLKVNVHASLAAAAAVLAYYLLFIMLGVVFEVRSETLVRLVGTLSCGVMWALDPLATLRNVIATFVLSLVVLAIDVSIQSRRFTPAYWSRLAVICGMALLGLLLLRLLSVLWVWHGIWHVYFIGATYLVLLAQRYKKEMLQVKGGGRAGGGSGVASGTAQGTPLKRRGPGHASTGASAGVLEGGRQDDDHSSTSSNGMGDANTGVSGVV